MENATKAFIIAGGMLIAMLIVGLLVWGYNNISSFQRTNVETEALEQIAEFNSRFEAYNRGSVRGYQMISLANLARDYNSRFREDEGYYQVEIIAKLDTQGANLPEATSAQRYAYDNSYFDMIKYIEEIYEPRLENATDPNNRNQFKEMYFECTKVVYDNERDDMTGTNNHGLGRVKRMEFEQVQVINSR